MNHSPILHVGEDYKIGLYRRNIYGLNIFGSNNIEVPTTDDPLIIFLSTLSENLTCSAHTGNLYDLADTPEEFFGQSAGENAFILAQTGIYGGSFYDVNEWPTFPACFFAEIKHRFWQAMAKEGQLDILEVISLDALALYVAPRLGAIEQMQVLVKQPFPSNDSWLRAVTGLYKMVIVTGGDGFYVHAYAEDASCFELLTPAIETTVKAVESSNWYQENKERLEWEPELSLCLKLPENRRA